MNDVEKLIFWIEMREDAQQVWEKRRQENAHAL
jgi:hypothetical protein